MAALLKANENMVTELTFITWYRRKFLTVTKPSSIHQMAIICSIPRIKTGGPMIFLQISMYDSIYWNSGSPDAIIFEISQGQFPDPRWKDWDIFIENSPIFNMENMNTPLLVEFGTDDGSVDFNQDLGR